MLWGWRDPSVFAPHQTNRFSASFHSAGALFPPPPRACCPSPATLCHSQLRGSAARSSQALPFVFVVFCPGFFGPFLQFSGSFWNFNPALKCICRSSQAAHRWGFNHCSIPSILQPKEWAGTGRAGQALHLPLCTGIYCRSCKPEGTQANSPCLEMCFGQLNRQENDCKISNKEMDSGKAGMLRQLPITPRENRDPSMGWSRTGRAPGGAGGWGQHRGDLWGPFTPNRKGVKSPEQHECHTWGSSSMECLSLDFSSKDSRTLGFSGNRWGGARQCVQLPSPCSIHPSTHRDPALPSGWELQGAPDDGNLETEKAAHFLRFPTGKCNIFQ